MGKKSGPLAFLNKKGWHPGNMRNQEKVWKKEQEALAEQKQVEELRKQYDEARQKEEVEALAVAAGVKKKQERLDWMYQGGMVAKQEAEKRADAQLLGEKEVDLPAADDQSKAEQLTELPSFYTTDTPASANEMWQRLHGDPMFAIKQQELMARKKIVSNPVQMDSIRKSLMEKAKAKAARKAAKAEAKAAKRAAKKAKKEKKRRREADKQTSSSSDSEASSDGRPSKRPRSDGHAHHTNGRGLSGDRHAHQLRREGHSPGHTNGASHRDDRSRGGSGRRRSRSREGHHSRDEPRRVEKGGYERARGDRRRGSEPPDERRGEPPRSVRTYHDAASAQARDSKYGISHADGRAAEDREEQRRETERRLEEAAAKKAQEEREKAAQRYHRKEYKTGKLSEEEKARRLAEMSGNANVHEEARWARLQAARKRDDSEEAVEATERERAAAANAAPGSRHQDTARFLTQATKDVYGGEAATLADRVGRRKYYNDRSREDDSNAFRR